MTDRPRRVDVSPPPGVYGRDGSGAETWSDAVRVGDTVWVTGQLGWEKTTGCLIEGPVEAEIERALQNLGTVLASAGAGFADVVQVRAYLVRHDDYAVYDSLFARYFGTNRPARVTVVVAELIHHARFDIEAVAIIQPASSLSAEVKKL